MGRHADSITGITVPTKISSGNLAERSVPVPSLIYLLGVSKILEPSCAQSHCLRVQLIWEMTKPGTSQDAIELLKADHAEVAELFDKYEDGRSTSEQKAAVAQQLAQSLSIHAQIEEEIFYPAAREYGGDEVEDLLDEAEVEHGSIKDLVASIEAGSPGDDLYDAQVTVCGEWVKHHDKEEENELFPKIRESGIDLEALGEQLLARKEELMSGASAEKKAVA